MAGTFDLIFYGNDQETSITSMCGFAGAFGIGLGINQTSIASDIKPIGDWESPFQEIGVVTTMATSLGIATVASQFMPNRNPNQIAIVQQSSAYVYAMSEKEINDTINLIDKTLEEKSN